jgi:4-amino-4-deoxy-L-arabinose transferase-like glycosyltransferase
MPAVFSIISLRKPVPVLLFFSLLALVLRFFSFFPSVIDHDESTYLEIARMILAGKTLYVDMVDIKPPGIFLLLAGFEAVFGYSVFVIRLLVTIWVALTAFMIYKTSILLVKDEKASVASGVIYIFLISTWSFYGLSVTPEIFFNLFTVSALFVLLKKQGLLNYMLAGLLAGVGFMMKYLVLFDFTVFMVFFFILNLLKNDGIKLYRITFHIFLAGLCFLIPFGLANLVYYLNGHFDAFYNIVYLSPARYPSVPNPWKMVKFVIDFQLRFLPVFFFFYYAIINKKFISPEISLLKKLCIFWSLMTLVAVLLAGKTYGHYTIQIMLPVSLMAGTFFHSRRELPSYLRWPLKRNTGRVIMAVLILLISAVKLEYIFKKDIPREIANYLEPRLKPGDVIYTGNYQHIIYYLLKKNSPTKYIHRSLLTADNHIRALDINADEEFRHIMAQWPVYIITENDYPPGMMKDFIVNNYHVEKDFTEGILLYRLNIN